MVDRMGAWRRRRVLAGMVGATAALAAPAIVRAAPSGKPVRVGGTLSLTGFLAQTAVIHKIAAEIMVEEINSRNGFLGRPVEYVLLDDQSKPDVARSLYEKLITVDKVDLIQGPYATAPILAAMGVAQRYGKVMIQSSMGIPKLQTYDRAFPATPFGPEPDKTYPNVILDMMAAMPTPPKTMVVLTSKFPSAQFMAQGMRDQAEKRGVKVLLYLEYELGNRDFGAIAARVKEANPDFLWVGSLGLESNQLLELLRKLDYTPKNSFHLYPAPGPLALSPDGDKALCSTFLEPDEPFMSRPGMKKLAAGVQGEGDQGQPALHHHRRPGLRHGLGMADPRGRRERRGQPRGREDRGLAQEEPGDHDLRQPALRRSLQPRRRRPAHQAGAEQGVEGRLADGVRRARREADRVVTVTFSSPRFAWGGARAAGGGVMGIGTVAHDPSVAV